MSSPASEISNMEDQLRTIREQMRGDNSTPFTKREPEQAMLRSNIRSAAGLDGVSNRLLKMAYENSRFQEVLLTTNNAPIRINGTYPECLKIAKVIPLPKEKPGV